MADGFDAVRWLRRRLCAHAAWFQAVPNRLLEAQAQRRGDEMWPRRVADAVDRVLAELDDTGRLAAPDLEQLGDRPSPRLFDLEVCDRAAWDLAGNNRAAPVDLVGEGADARHVVRLAAPRAPRTALQVGVLYSHLRHHAVVPLEVRAGDGRTYPVRIAPMVHGARLDRISASLRDAARSGGAGPFDRTSASLRDAARSGGAGPFDRIAASQGDAARSGGAGPDDGRRAPGVTVATVSFRDGGMIEWTTGDRGARAVDVGGIEARAATFASSMAQAAQHGVDVLVAPELTLPPGPRDRELGRLRWAKEPRLGLVVPGSFHEQEVDGHFNRALVVDGQGNSVLGDVVLAHRKLAVFGPLAPGEGQLVEDIDGGSGITAVATPIGLVAVAICKDFCDVHVGDIWRQLQPEWLLVPAYGPGLEAHARAAQVIALTSGTITVLAHEPLHSAAGPPESFVHGATAAPPPPDAAFLLWGTGSGGTTPGTR